mmetsp:Transcript_12259/g.30928  ORF Transcript_12259/g.30928 Transcript_12259/m.30928 type:complete len:295 (-) Transcript_12259:56-940(-)
MGITVLFHILAHDHPTDEKLHLSLALLRLVVPEFFEDGVAQLLHNLLGGLFVRELENEFLGAREILVKQGHHGQDKLPDLADHLRLAMIRRRRHILDRRDGQIERLAMLRELVLEQRVHRLEVQKLHVQPIVLLRLLRRIIRLHKPGLDRELLILNGLLQKLQKKLDPLGQSRRKIFIYTLHVRFVVGIKTPQGVRDARREAALEAHRVVDYVEGVETPVARRLDGEEGTGAVHGLGGGVLALAARREELEVAGLDALEGGRAREALICGVGGHGGRGKGGWRGRGDDESDVER